MSYLISKILPCLLLALLLGAIIGWLLKRSCKNRQIESYADEDIDSHGVYEAQAESRELAELKSKLYRVQLNVEDSKSKIDKYDLKIKDSDLHIQSLEIKLSENATVVQEFDVLKSKLLRVEQNLKDKDNKLQSLKSKLAVSSNSNSDANNLKIKLDEANTIIDRKNQEMSLLNGRLIDSDLNLVKATKDFTGLKVQNIVASQDNSSTISKPKFLEKPREGKVDNLELIKGIGGKLHKVLNELGVFHFDQIASWSQKEVGWVNDHLVFSGRIQREEWILQAKGLMAGKQSNFSNNVSAKPELYDKPRDGKADNLQLIKGVGKKLEEVLYELGVYHFDQIASWNQKEINWVSEHLVFTGRIEREKWILQAKDLIGGGETEFSKRVKKGEVPTSDRNK